MTDSCQQIEAASSPAVLKSPAVRTEQQIGRDAGLSPSIERASAALIPSRAPVLFILLSLVGAVTHAAQTCPRSIAGPQFSAVLFLASWALAGGVLATALPAAPFLFRLFDSFRGRRQWCGDAAGGPPFFGFVRARCLAALA